MRAAVRLIGGIRPLALVAIGLGWIGYGRGILTDPRYGTARGLVNLTRYVELSTLGWLWVSAGAIAVAGGLCGGPRLQAAGFAAIASPAFLWGLQYTRVWLTGGFPSASGSAAAWMAFAVFVTAAANLSEPAWVVDALKARSMKGNP